MCDRTSFIGIIGPAECAKRTLETHYVYYDFDERKLEFCIDVLRVNVKTRDSTDDRYTRYKTAVSNT